MCSAPVQRNAVGFERPPVGRLLEQIVDFEDSVGVAYERCIGYEKDFHIHDRVNVTFPRGPSVIAFTLEGEADMAPGAARRSLSIDSRCVLWMPARAVHRQDNMSVIYDNLALFPDDACVARALETTRERMGMRGGAAAGFVPPSTTVKALRTPLLDELLTQFFYDRVVRGVPSAALAGLANEILVESLRLFLKRANPSARGANESSVVWSATAETDVPLARAIKHIEANLFTPLTIERLADVSGTSATTLYRKFQSELQLTPLDYVRRRRLDEARHLLQRGESGVGEVALLIGFEDAASFSKAFRARFGYPPSQELPQAAEQKKPKT